MEANTNGKAGSSFHVKIFDGINSRYRDWQTFDTVSKARKFYRLSVLHLFEYTDGQLHVRSTRLKEGYVERTDGYCFRYYRGMLYVNDSSFVRYKSAINYIHEFYP